MEVRFYASLFLRSLHLGISGVLSARIPRHGHVAAYRSFRAKNALGNRILNRHPFPDVVHGCLLEGMALALEGRLEPFSQGRGSLPPERVAEMETIAARHGIYLAPLYNADGPVEDGPPCQTE